jgi:hypothetical protein
VFARKALLKIRINAGKMMIAQMVFYALVLQFVHVGYCVLLQISQESVFQRRKAPE